MTDPEVVWLEDVSESAPALLGGKGDRLAALVRAGFSVPPGFCVTTQAYRIYLAANGMQTSGDAVDIRKALAYGFFPTPLQEKIVEAYNCLKAEEVAVRSSAIGEDQTEASSAGQQETYLNVKGAADLIAAIRGCWISLWSDHAIAYRQARRQTAEEPRMAVVIQTMIPCELAGVAFSVDPVTGQDSIVIEATRGLGNYVVGGYSEVERFTVDRASGRIVAARACGVLNEQQAGQIRENIFLLERAFNQSLDVEWGFWSGNFYIFQSRPITVASRSFFTEVISQDRFLWTSVFLNERFSRPLSPLGWTLIRQLLEPLAFRDPLRYLGYHGADDMPVTKLYRGHPFVNVHFFQIVYKSFPDRLLPEDAPRYFLQGDAASRREAEYPGSILSPRLWIALFRNFLRDPSNWSPLHNYRNWKKFVRAHNEQLKNLAQKFSSLEASAEPAGIWDLFKEAQNLNVRLLSIHRWSLTHADIFYSALRRMLKAWLGDRSGSRLSALLISGLPSKSIELNRALQDVVTQADWEAFVVAYGHRSFSLDIFHPTFAEEPERIRALTTDAIHFPDSSKRLSDREQAVKEAHQLLRRQSRSCIKRLILDRIVFYAQQYMQLREDQRFYWQSTLALQRRICLWMGRHWAARGLLKQADDIFFATLDEVHDAVRQKELPLKELTQRRIEFERLDRLCQFDSSLSCPRFLQGNNPITEAGATALKTLYGLPVSPGVALGPARIITSPNQFGKIAPGDILVTRGADPGWTPVFGRIAGLVMEAGGQLSHGAVVAREYGIPAVADIQGAMQLLKEGQEIAVDGFSGTVSWK